MGKHFFIITQGDNKLTLIGKNIKANFLEYINETGKFSSFSAVGLLPAKLIGLDPKDIITGALNALNSPKKAIKAAYVAYQLLSQGYSINVISYYKRPLHEIEFFSLM